MIMNILKKLIIILFLVNINQSVMAKPVPPGSGEGDVPANILILLDNSKSMKSNKIGLGIEDARGVTIDGSDNKIISSSSTSRGGLYKYDSAGDPINFTGTDRDTGVTYETPNWFPSAATDYRCDYKKKSNDGNSVSTSFNQDLPQHRRTAHVKYITGVTVGGTSISNENLIFFLMWANGGNSYVIGIEETTLQCRIMIEVANANPVRNFDITLRGSDHIFTAIGTTSGNSRTRFVTCNLTQGGCLNELAIGKHAGTTAFGQKAAKSWEIQLDNEAEHVFVSDGKGFYGFTLSSATVPEVAMGMANKNCPGRSSGLLNRVQDHIVFDVKHDDNNIFFAASKKRRHIQRLTFPAAGGNCSIASQSTLGKKGNEANIGAAGGLAFNQVYITTTPTSLEAIGDRVLITHGAYVDEFSGNKILGGQRDTAWQNQVGGGRMSRWDGAKKALASVLSDSTLTAGANFGFGWWSAGENNRDGGYCDKNGKYCSYWNGWNAGKNWHQDCGNNYMNACLRVPIGTEGASQAINLLNTIPVRWGTDSHAWSHVAHGYFSADAPNGTEKMFDPNSTCQLNYIIVVSDGLMRNHGIPEISTNPNKRGNTQEKVIELRGMGVKTLMVAYGDGIADRGMNVFDYLAMRGSCDATTLDEAADRRDCDPTIVARTPTELKTRLAAKIRQILAEKLSFTAPSITASIQEGGSLYQAQFKYEQYGEWRGTIKRREITGSGEVFIEHENNWDAGDEILKQTKNGERNFWTALPVPEESDDDTDEQKEARKSLNYIGNWNNFSTTEDNLFSIDALFDQLGFSLTDYHNSTSECSVDNGRVTADVGEDGTADELTGLINFVRGEDYFDYNGNCIIDEVREHVLGDIYHSQLIEIGPPDANVDFNNSNEEAYYRSINNYHAFQTEQSNRKSIIYAGSNSGILHAINAKTGQEEWAFVPPFIAGKFPNVINPDLDGSVTYSNKAAGGTNAIFGVDGSPVVHDVFIKGLNPDGTLEQSKSWHTILFVPYGRGGSGFSVLDVTNPLVKDGIGPLHMFSVYNDFVNNKVYIMNYNGDIIDGGYEYEQTQFNLSDSREAKKADRNYDDAANADNEGMPNEVYTNRSGIDECKNDSNFTGTNKFMDVGDTSCYSGKTFHFDNALGADGTTFSKNIFQVFKTDGGIRTKLEITSAKMVGGYLRVEFDTDYTYNTGRTSDAGSVEGDSDSIYVSTTCDNTTGIPAEYDYSKLGETWSTPRIVRLPDPDNSSLSTTTDKAAVMSDKYVAIMGAGMSSNYLCAGSALYLVDLSDIEQPGKLFGYKQNNGPILIADTEIIDVGQDGTEDFRGSDITNAVPTNPVVITPDTAFGIPWRGALVYINDREGKITKINLTNMNAGPDVDMFDQTTLYTLNANTDNKRYTFFSMDAGIGVTTKDLWLFGGTGNFNALGERHNLMDNIMYGVRDVHYPSFEHLNGVHIPLPDEGGDFMGIALEGAYNARSIDDTRVCVDATGNTVKITSGTNSNCPKTEDAWKVRLDSAADANKSDHTFRKTSAPPTLFKGQVYYPIYEPPPGENRCSIGNAYICVTDDECGTNNTYKLIKGASPQENDASCHFVRQGVLSELVIFGDKLFANVAGPSEDEDTLYSILAAPGEVVGNSSGWRESGF